jgi:Tfp pilus assembly protein PilO
VSAAAPASGPAQGGRMRFRPGAPSGPAAAGEPEAPERKEPGKFFREYYGAAFLFLVAAFILAGYFFLYPLVQEFKTINQEIQSQSQVLTDERTFLDTLNQSIAAAQAIPADVLMRVNEALPREIEIPKLLQNMSRIAEAHGVGLTSVQFSEPPASPAAQTGGAGPTLVPVEISMKVDAPDYATMRAYLEDIERNLRVLDMRTINVTANEQTGELTYEIRVVAYSASFESRSAPSGAVSAGGAAVPAGASFSEALGNVR